MAQTSALPTLTKRLGYSFSDEDLLEQALTHRSVGSVNNERMEFLGDGILNFVIAEVLYCQFPSYPEGDLSRLRAHFVNGETLADIARELNLGDYLRLGAGELKSGGFRRSSILADVVESILGAVYCDAGFDECRNLILRLYATKLKNIPGPQSLKDAKTQLQELLQSRKISIPVYKVLKVSGKSHEQTFSVECAIESMKITSQGEGHSRRKAEQCAAEAAIEIVQQQFGI